MTTGIITQVDRIDDFVYEFYEKLDSEYLNKNPEFRFLLLSPLLNNLCTFNLANNSKSFNDLLSRSKISKSAFKKLSDNICSGIRDVIGEPSYFAASYWSPIDNERHTISHSKEKSSPQEEHKARVSALLFYILSYKAPSNFYSAISYISKQSPRKDGLHSYYNEKNPLTDISENKNYQIWWHLPISIHQSLLDSSGFSTALNKLLKVDAILIEKSLTILMEYTDKELVENEIKKYEGVYLPIVENSRNFTIPTNLINWSNEFETFLNNFFYPPDIFDPNKHEKLTTVQSFFMACTHALYNLACPTEMFYVFPVRVSNTCCVLTLGVDKKLELENILAMSHIVKSIFYHALDIDYRALNALERNRIAHGAVHKIRGPLNILKEFPYDLEELLKSGLSEKEFEKIKSNLLFIKKTLKNSIENILIGVKSLENFIDIENPGKFSLIDVINNAKRTYDSMEVRIMEKIEIENLTNKNIIVYGVASHIQFIIEELISNSIRAFKFYDSKIEYNKLNIKISISQKPNQPYYFLNYYDNGLGIPYEKKNRIFFSGSRGNDSGGSGKGLFLSKLFLNKYGNDIIECGEYGKGVNFELTFKKIDNEVESLNR
mgnify:CR=1 FL=1